MKKKNKKILQTSFNICDLHFSRIFIWCICGRGFICEFGVFVSLGGVFFSCLDWGALLESALNIVRGKLNHFKHCLYIFTIKYIKFI